jgi:hypothetical protein
VVFGLLAGVWLSAQEVPSVAVRPLAQPLPSGMEALAKSLTDNWTGQWKKAGFAVLEVGTSPPARFEARGLLVREKGNLVLQLEVTDLPSHTVVASDMLAVYEGLTSFDLINAAFTAAVQKTRGYWELVKKTPLPVPPLQDALVFESKDEGAEVFWQGHQSIGHIIAGRLMAPYYPFPSNAVLTLTVEKAGRRTKTFNVTLDPGKTTYTLPVLEKLRVDELHFLWEGGQLLGAGVEYRHYLMPDWAFWAVEAYPFVQFRPDVSGSQPVAHLTTYGSLGSWLYFPADSWFRFGVEASAGLIQTYTVSSPQPGWYLDAAVVPFGFLLEWNLWGVTIENRIQVPYSLGLPTGLLPQEWLLIDSNVPLLSVGVVWKW